MRRIIKRIIKSKRRRIGKLEIKIAQNLKKIIKMKKMIPCHNYHQEEKR